jgi:hypothetical protein
MTLHLVKFRNEEINMISTINDKVKPEFKLKTLVTCLGLVMSTSTLSFADERESLEQLKETTTSLIQLLVDEGVLSQNKAEAMLTQAEAKGKSKARAAIAREKKELAGEVAPKDNAVRVQYVPEHVKKKLRDEIKQEVMTQAKTEGWAAPNEIPEWTNRIAFNGDMRLRYEHNGFSSENFLPVDFANSPNRFTDINNTTEDRDRTRVRARIGVKVKVNDWLEGGLRLTTGPLTTPVSQNETANVSRGKYTLGLDRVFLKAQPYSWLTLEAGRFTNPWLYSELVWDRDLAFDGAAAIFNYPFNNQWSTFGTVGVFPIEDIETSDTNLAESKWLYGAQAGLKWTSANKSSVKVGIAYYDFTNVEGKENPVTNTTAYDATVPAFRQKGNNTFDINQNNTADPLYALASEFKLINLTTQLDLVTFNPVHVTLTGDYVRNVGFDRGEILRRTGADFKEENEGYSLRLDVGKPAFIALADVPSGPIEKNDWQVALGYQYIEADAVLDGFNNSNFHLGGTDAKGWLLEGNYGVAKNTWVNVRYFSTDEISGLPLGIDVLLLDLNAKF